MKHTIITIKNRDSSVSQILEFKGDISIIYIGNSVTIIEMIGLNQTRQTDIILNHGQLVNVRNWGTK